MTKPAIISEIDEALKSVRPAGIRPWMSEEVADQVRPYEDPDPEPELDPDAPPIVKANLLKRQHFYRGVEIPIVTTPGTYAVRIDEAYRFRDPETGQFIAHEEPTDG